VQRGTVPEKAYSKSKQVVTLCGACDRKDTPLPVSNSQRKQSSKVSAPVGAIMKELRILAAVTLQDAANMIGVAHSTIRQAEMGRARLTIDQIRSLIRFYAPEVQKRLNLIQELLESETVNSDLPAENLRGAANE
jgi:DNA-binding XRE family transcriptional regulator